MFWLMVKGALIRQRGRFFLIALTVALGVSLASAMLNVMFDVGDKVNQELKPSAPTLRWHRKMLRFSAMFTASAVRADIKNI